ncbi:hypothetical protein BN1013_00286 [Candidatus Rubidus massiliensis]|mgnify:CR=1 FL=1|nr:hypothetical protein BN1013_00286 [Candidatus Rubidus massiliensis]
MAKEEAKYKFLLIIFFVYFIPYCSLAIYNFQYLASEDLWNILSIGLLIPIFGTLLLFYSYLTFQKNVTLQANLIPTDQSVLQELSDQNEQALLNVQEELKILQDLFDAKKQEIEVLTKDNVGLKKEKEMIAEQIKEHKKEIEAVLEEKEKKFQESILSINDLRATIEKKQNYINQLESKVRDLNYEIKTLLKLADLGIKDLEEPKKESVQPTLINENIASGLPLNQQVKSWEDASIQLKRCMELAQKQSSSNQFYANNYLYKESSLDSFALDLRTLFDNLRNENNASILFFAPKENKVLFANPPLRKVLGLNHEKISQHFFDCLDPSLEKWNKAIAQLTLKNEVKTTFEFKTKHNDKIYLNALVGVIPSGIFRNQVIIIFFESETKELTSEDELFSYSLSF